MLPVHVIAGALALGAAGVALYAVKGSPLHRKSGLVFVGTMLVLAGTGALMAVFVVPDGANVVAGLLTFYMVGTAVLTVRPPVEHARDILKGLMVAALVLGAFAFGLGLEAMQGPADVLDGIPALPLFLYAAAGIAGGLGDARLLRAGSIQGTARLLRHAWRMAFGLFIATTAFFLGQAQVFPEPIRKFSLLSLPAILVLLVLLYWVIVLGLRGRRVADYN